MIDDLKLPPGQRERLEQELLGAFGRTDLEVLARRLGIQLAHIAEGSLKEVVSRFVEEVGRLGQGVALIRMARRANPTHPGLNKFLTTLRPRVFKGAQLDELVQLLQAAGLPWGLLEQQFWLCVPDTWSSPLANGLQDEAERVADLVDVLSEYTESGLSRQVLPLF
ncbi:MAG TPA: effector-associated domain EAD1-containing protein, partial [Myxococcaceae bacterium]|nr:effector-associated domain EAD1-containing protein [Myxococcaceae bacterium]